MTDGPENEQFIIIGDRKFGVRDTVYILEHCISNVRTCIGNTGTIKQVLPDNNSKVRCDACGNDGVVIDSSVYQS